MITKDFLDLFILIFNKLISNTIFVIYVQLISVFFIILIFRKLLHV